ncbi:MAG: hypothetical protein WBK55_06760 [Alphaproteobacteria bacterium]
MAKDSQRFFDAAKGRKRELSDAFSATGVDFAKAPEESLDPVVAAARKFLQGFANLGNAEGVRNTLYDAGYSGSVSSIILGSSAPNYDTGMGGSAGKQDEKKKQEEWDRLFRLQQQLAERLREIDWEIEKIDGKIHDTKEHIARLDHEKAEIEERIAIYDDHLSGKKPLKVGADGKLENEKIEKALQDYERRTGKKVDRKNPEEFAAAVEEMRVEDHKRLLKIKEEHKECEEKLKIYSKEKDKWEIEKTKTKEHKDEVDKEFKNADEAIKNTKLTRDTGDQKQIIKAESAESEVRHGIGTLNLDAAETEPDASIDLSTSAASRIDQDNTNSSIRGSFKTAHGTLQTSDDAQGAELSRQDKAPAVKSPV